MLVIFQNKKDFPFLLVHPIELIHLDVWGQYSIPLIHGHKYFLTIVDEYSRYMRIFISKQKSEIVKTLENFVVFVKQNLRR